MGEERQLAPQAVVAIGGSAGAFGPLRALVASLDPGLPISVLIAFHMSPDFASDLPQLLGELNRFPATYPLHGERIRAGEILVAPPDNHLAVSEGRTRVFRGPKENGQRPSIDRLFRSVAREYRERAIGVVLSGGMGCGSEGLLGLKRAGGVTIVQSPQEADNKGMPTAAIALVRPDHVLLGREMGARINDIVEGWAKRRPPPGEAGASPRSESVREAAEHLLSCPDCGGALAESEGATPEFACKVGHGYSLNGLFMQQTEALETALWAAVRSLSESEEIALRAAVRSERRVAGRLRERARSLAQHREVIRAILEGGRGLGTSELTTAAEESHEEELPSPRRHH